VVGNQGVGEVERSLRIEYPGAVFQIEKLDLKKKGTLVLKQLDNISQKM